jgi:D-alanyl-lipoteichoic acid acyltransferase DltB (MBOAT superfamily)
MLFNSLHFLIFFPVVAALFFLAPHRYRLPLLFVASCYFYMAFIPSYILILFVLIAVDYVAGILIDRAEGPARKRLLWISLVANIGILGVFKYFNFFSENVAELSRALGLPVHPTLLHLALPIGLSFHTFQSMSYTIEVYRGRWKAERNLLVYAVYVLFFPQMVAGPIERPYNLLPQFHRDVEFDAERAKQGLRLMLWGFIMKVVVADRLAIYANQVFENPSAHHGLTTALGIYFFSFQIYCDFAGYSTIAIGAAWLLGYRLMTNFRTPYFASSVAEFWTRWHISLSSWFRDYLYIPLGGNRVSRWRWYFNLMFVFMVSGFWHGANWTFLVWGALHGLYLIGSIVIDPVRRSFLRLVRLAESGWVARLVGVFITFHLVTLAWVFFRARSMSDAWLLLENLVHPEPGGLTFDYPMGSSDFTLALLSIVALVTAELLRGRITVTSLIGARPVWVRWGVYYAAVLGILFFGVLTQSRFIYFQF